RAADEHGRDGVELPVESVLRTGCDGARHEDHAGQGGEDPHVDHEQEVDATRIDAGELRGRSVAAHRVDVAAKDRVSGEEGVEHDEHAEDDARDREAGSHAAAREGEARRDDDGHQNDQLDERDPERDLLGTELLAHPARAELPDDDGHRHDESKQKGEVVVSGVRADLRQIAAADGGEAVWHGDRIRVADELVATAEDEHSGEGDDERRYPDVRDPEALPGTDQRADDQTEHDRERPRQVPVLHRAGYNDAAEGGNRTDREVDVAGDDEHHHADREDQDVGVLADQVDQVTGVQGEAVGQRLEEHDDDDQAEQDAELAEVGGAAA